VLVVLLVQVLASSAYGIDQIFTNDPFGERDQESERHHMYHVFMRLNSLPPCSLHTGIDVAGWTGQDTVFAAHASPYVAKVDAVVDDYVFLSVPEVTQGPEEYLVQCRYLHIDPLVDTGDYLCSGDPVGVLNRDHLHEEILINENEQNFGMENLANPLIFANDSSYWASIQAEEYGPQFNGPPEVKEVGNNYEWEISATDQHVIGSASDDNDGIFDYSVSVDGWGEVFRHKFDRYLNKDGTAVAHWREFYCQFDTVNLCYRAVWEPGGPVVLDGWDVRVCDAVYHCNNWDSERTGCLYECETWGCIKSCFEDDGIGVAFATWPSPKGCTQTPGGTVCHPQGVFGRVGGFAAYWGGEDPNAWAYQVWESEQYRESYECIATKCPGPAFHHAFRLNLADSSQYFYQVASLDTVMRESTPSPGIGCVVGVGQCRISGTACCTALDTTGAILFIGESGGIVDVVDVSDPRDPVIIATHNLSNLGLWDNLYDGPYELHYDSRLWAVCGNKGLAVLDLSGSYQYLDTLCTYPVSGTGVSLFQSSPSCHSEPFKPPTTVAYYTTADGKLEVLELEDDNPGEPYLRLCGEYRGPAWPSYYDVRGAYCLTSQDGCLLYVAYDCSGDFDGMHVVDISSPCDPTFVGMFDQSEFWGLEYQIKARDADRVYGQIKDYQIWTTVVDICDPWNPIEVARWENLLFNQTGTKYDRNSQTRVACDEGRLFAGGQALVHYPEPSRYGTWARWGGAECYTVCPDGSPLFAAAFTDTGFDAAGDTSLMISTVTAANGRVYATYKCCPDTDSVQDLPFHRLKVYLDHWEPMYGSGVDYYGEKGTSGIYLSPAWPNPFHRDTEIDISVPATTRIRISVHDVTGRQVGMLADGWHGPGTYRLNWNGRDHRGKSVAPGVYFIHLQLGPHSATRKVVLLR
jgi:hypothetical protein